MSDFTIISNMIIERVVKFFDHVEVVERHIIDGDFILRFTNNSPEDSAPYYSTLQLIELDGVIHVYYLEHFKTTTRDALQVNSGYKHGGTLTARWKVWRTFCIINDLFRLKNVKYY